MALQTQSYASYFEATFPAESDVRTGTQYTDGVTAFTGTLDPGGAPDYPPVDDVRLGVAFDSGNLTGTVRVPPPENVLAGYDYDANDSVTGTLDPGAGGVVPAASDVRAGVPVGAGTGNVIVPDEADVKLSVPYDSNGSRTGTLDCGSSGDPGDVGWVG